MQNCDILKEFSEKFEDILEKFREFFGGNLTKIFGNFEEIDKLPDICESEGSKHLKNRE